jgi:hypothetical protein
MLGEEAHLETEVAFQRRAMFCCVGISNGNECFDSVAEEGMYDVFAKGNWK